MTPAYELLCDAKTIRINANCFERLRTMYYVSDKEIENVKAQLMVDMIVLAQLEEKNKKK